MLCSNSPKSSRKASIQSWRSRGPGPLPRFGCKASRTGRIGDEILTSRLMRPKSKTDQSRFQIRPLGSETSPLRCPKIKFPITLRSSLFRLSLAQRMGRALAHASPAPRPFQRVNRNYQAHLILAPPRRAGPLKDPLRCPAFLPIRKGPRSGCWTPLLKNCATLISILCFHQFQRKIMLPIDPG
jgi:hypothetical protein